MSFHRDTWEGVGAIAAATRAPRSAPAPTVVKTSAFSPMTSRPAGQTVPRPLIGTYQNAYVPAVTTLPPPPEQTPTVGTGTGTGATFGTAQPLPGKGGTGGGTGGGSGGTGGGGAGGSGSSSWSGSKAGFQQTIVQVAPYGGQQVMYVCPDGSRVVDPRMCPRRTKSGSQPSPSPDVSAPSSSVTPWLIGAGVLFLLLR